ncbi:hypothetical protein ACVIW0_005469 [Bradyrhizobium sp. USDA 4454]
MKGSTALYEHLGDLNAYALVREHFALLDAVAHKHAGAIVKTIGDAVMAAFSRPVDAVAAALHMLQEIGSFNREHGQPAIILKMGGLRAVHCRDPQRQSRLLRPDREHSRASAIIRGCRRNLSVGGTLYSARRS